MRIYRLNHKDHKNSPFSGGGAARYPGRWNTAGVPAVYCSTSVALAFVEMLVNAPMMKFQIAEGLFDLVVAEFDERRIKAIQIDEMPANWNSYPHPQATQALGAAWLRDKKVLALSVPSAVFEQDRNIVLNPGHPDFKSKCKIISQPTFLAELRLVKLLGAMKPSLA